MHVIALNPSLAFPAHYILVTRFIKLILTAACSNWLFNSLFLQLIANGTILFVDPNLVSGINFTSKVT